MLRRNRTKIHRHRKRNDETQDTAQTSGDAMTWLQRYHMNRVLRDTVWLPPLVVMVLVLLAHPLVGRLDGILSVKAVIGPESARALLAALASSMLTCNYQRIPAECHGLAIGLDG
jgi:uncharacterized membrane protein